MAVYRNISVNFWNDAKVDDDFTPEDKYFYLYLITNPHTNISGCYEIGMKQMERETGYNEDTIKRLLIRMEKQHKVIRYNEQTKEILLINWSKYNWHRSEKLISAVLKESEKIKSEAFKTAIRDLVDKKIEIESLKPITETVSETVTVSDTVSDTVKGIDTVSIPYAYPIDTVSTSKSKRFETPTVDEVKAYCSERKNNVDAQHFIDHYSSNGWKVGKNPMKDWKAAVRTWERNNFGNSKQNADLDNEGYYTEEGYMKAVNAYTQNFELADAFHRLFTSTLDSGRKIKPEGLKKTFDHISAKENDTQRIVAVKQIASDIEHGRY